MATVAITIPTTVVRRNMKRKRLFTYGQNIVQKYAFSRAYARIFSIINQKRDNKGPTGFIRNA